jgi:hypothetical protein
MDTTQHQTSNINMSAPKYNLTPAVIRHQANNFNAQIRIGLEEGNIRQVVKTLEVNLVSRNMVGNEHWLIFSS